MTEILENVADDYQGCSEGRLMSEEKIDAYEDSRNSEYMQHSVGRMLVPAAVINDKSTNLIHAYSCLIELSSVLESWLSPADTLNDSSVRAMPSWKRILSV